MIRSKEILILKCNLLTRIFLYCDDVTVVKLSPRSFEPGNQWPLCGKTHKKSWLSEPLSPIWKYQTVVYLLHLFFKQFSQNDDLKSYRSYLLGKYNYIGTSDIRGASGAALCQCGDTPTRSADALDFLRSGFLLRLAYWTTPVWLSLKNHGPSALPGPSLAALQIRLHLR